MSIDVSEINFNELVLKKSSSVPVLVDFWAPWCGPCRMLGPILEKLEKEYVGEFILAKVNTDQNPKISTAYKISGIPAVKLFIDGKVKDEFTGALPEKSVKEFLLKYLTSKDVKEILELQKRDITLAANKVIEQKVTGEIAESILWNAALGSLLHNKQDIAKNFLAAIPEVGSTYSDHKNYLNKFLSSNKDEESIQYILKVLNKGEEEKALEFFLKKIELAPSGKRLEVKDDLLTCFFLLGNSGDLVNQYRRKLSSLLY